MAADPALCEPSPRPRPRVDCHVPCPADCILSAWSDWSACPPGLRCEGHGGLSGQQQPHHRPPRLPLRQRNRTVIAVAGRDGQVCCHMKKDKYRRDGKGRRCCLGTELIQFLAALAIFHQDDMKKRIIRIMVLGGMDALEKLMIIRFKPCTTNHHSPKMYFLPMTFLQINHHCC